ncbi:unannotated protein [freshwater metagenome]|uniref:Unannotated protein n=1 Tax=freshwater metagenome TaxID=449393 RepID=A0A6J7FDG9_9ZZZZ
MPMDALVVAGLNGTNRHSPSPAGRVQPSHSAGRVQPVEFGRSSSAAALRADPVDDGLVCLNKIWVSQRIRSL